MESAIAPSQGAHRAEQSGAAEPTIHVPHLVRIKEFAKQYKDAVSEGGLRWQVFNAETNGLQKSGAIVRIPNARGEIGPHSPILLNPPKYFAWLLASQKRAA
jgi:hypothetical protein